jgi:hypothetical protein
VQGDLGVDRLRSVDALEVSVQDQLLVCVHLEVAQQDLLGLAFDFQVQDGTVESFFLERVPQGVAVQGDQLTGAAAPP